MFENGTLKLLLDSNGAEGLRAEDLPEVGPRFHVPSLVDKPQNPIMDTLKLLQDLNLPQRALTLPKELEILTTDICASLQRDSDTEGSLWRTGAPRDAANTNVREE